MFQQLLLLVLLSSCNNLRINHQTQLNNHPLHLSLAQLSHNARQNHLHIKQQFFGNTRPQKIHSQLNPPKTQPSLLYKSKYQSLDSLSHANNAGEQAQFQENTKSQDAPDQTKNQFKKLTIPQNSTYVQNILPLDYQTQDTFPTRTAGSYKLIHKVSQKKDDQSSTNQYQQQIKDDIGSMKEFKQNEIKQFSFSTCKCAISGSNFTLNECHSDFNCSLSSNIFLNSTKEINILNRGSIKDLN